MQGIWGRDRNFRFLDHLLAQRVFLRYRFCAPHRVWSVEHTARPVFAHESPAPHRVLPFSCKPCTNNLYIVDDWSARWINGFGFVPFHPYKFQGGAILVQPHEGGGASPSRKQRLASCEPMRPMAWPDYSLRSSVTEVADEYTLMRAHLVAGCRGCRVADGAGGAGGMGPRRQRLNPALQRHLRRAARASEESEGTHRHAGQLVEWQSQSGRRCQSGRDAYGAKTSPLRLVGKRSPYSLTALFATSSCTRSLAS